MYSHPRVRVDRPLRGHSRCDPQSASAILQELHSFSEMGSVLYIAAHPDDEITRLIAYSRAVGAIARYLSINGDGGHNLIGPELGANSASFAPGFARRPCMTAAQRCDSPTAREVGDETGIFSSGWAAM